MTEVARKTPTPVWDYVLDAVGVALLTLSLVLPWTWQHTGSERPEVLIAAIIAIIAVVVPYLAWFAITPEGRNVGRIRAVRVLLTVPYFGVAATYFVGDGLRIVMPDLSWAGGLGSSAALGLAGAALIAAPRMADVDASERAARPYRAVQGALWAVVGLMAVSQGVALFDFLRTASGQGVSTLTALRAGGAIALAGAVAIVSVVGMIRRSPAWRPVVITLGSVAVVVFVVLFSSVSEPTNDALSHAGGGMAWILTPMAGALAARPALAHLMKTRERYVSWLGTARRAWSYALGIVVAMLALSTVEIIQGFGADYVVLGLRAALAACAVWALVALRRDGRSRRAEAIIATALIALLAIGVAVLHLASANNALTYYDALLALGLPVLALIALVVPTSVRAFYRSHSAPTAPGHQGTPSENQTQVFPAVRAQGAPSSDTAVMPAYGGGNFAPAPVPQPTAPQPFHPQSAGPAPSASSAAPPVVTGQAGPVPPPPSTAAAAGPEPLASSAGETRAEIRRRQQQ